MKKFAEIFQERPETRFLESGCLSYGHTCHQTELPGSSAWQKTEYRNAVGKNQYRAQDEGTASFHIDDSSFTPNERRTSAQFGRLYNLNRTTVESYGKLSRSLDALERKAPGILPIILSGTCKISKENINSLAKMAFAFHL